MTLPEIKTPNSEKIPDELKSLKQWINWEYNYSEKDEIIKRPFGSANDPNNMNTFENAYENAVLNKLGLGFCFYKHDNIVGIDLDKKHWNPETNTLSEEALKIIQELNSYTERSPSGKGVHIIVKGEIPAAVKNSDTDVEIYDCDRYFTFTGDHLEDTPLTINEGKTALKALYEKHKKTDHKEPVKKPKPVTSWRNKHGWSLEAIRGKDKKLDSLLSGSDSAYGYDSASEADIALCEKLLIYEYTKDEVAGILHSYRYREKLDKNKTYVQRTVDNAEKHIQKENIRTISAYLDPRKWDPEITETKLPDLEKNTDYGDPVKLYKETRSFLKQNIDLVEEHDYDVLAAKVLESWLIGKFNEVGYIFFVGPPRSGKTRAMETLSTVCYNPVLAATMTTPSIYRILDKGDATLFLDEIQQYLQDEKTSFISILNAGQRRGLKAWLTVPTGDGWDVKGFEVFGSKFMASTEETARALSTRCVIIAMVKNARRVPLRINREWAQRLTDKLRAYQYDMKDKEIADVEQLLFKKKLRDYRNIEAFINLVAVVPLEYRETILNVAKNRDDQISKEENTGFYSDLFKALEEAYQKAEKGKVSIKAITEAYNLGKDESEQLDPRKIGREVNIMGLRESDRMNDGSMARRINERLMKRLRRRYGPAQWDLEEFESEVSEETDVSEVKEEGVETTSETIQLDKKASEVSDTPTSVTSETPETSETSVIVATREQKLQVIDDAKELFQQLNKGYAEHEHYTAYLMKKHNIPKKHLREILLESPLFIQRDAWGLKYLPLKEASP